MATAEMKLNMLRKEAQKITNWREHKMRWDMPDALGDTQYGQCVICGLWAKLDCSPAPNSVLIGGPAIELNCGDKVVEREQEMTEQEIINHLLRALREIDDMPSLEVCEAMCSLSWRYKMMKDIAREALDFTPPVDAEPKSEGSEP